VCESVYKNDTAAAVEFSKSKEEKLTVCALHNNNGVAGTSDCITVTTCPPNGSNGTNGGGVGLGVSAHA
jgi:hypothetical protein